MKTIKIFDTTLRDGEQSPGASLNKQEKLQVATQLKNLNVDIIEAGFPAASNDDFEAVKEIAAKIKGPIICGLARTLKKDIDLCWQAVSNSENPRIHVFIATSEVHINKKLRKTEQQILEIIQENVSYAKSLCNDIEFSPEDAARTNIDFMIKAVETAINAGATTINIPDTVGYSMPDEFAERIKKVFDNFENLIKEKNVTISVHCHNDLGNAVSNSLAAIKQGASQIECTINGLGERAGNAALEEIVMNINTRKDYFNATTNINLKEIFKTSKLVSELTGIEVQRNKAVVGKNAFAHEAGVHQHGILSDSQTYEIMYPEEIGWQGENLVIGKHSGKHAIKEILEKNNIFLDEERLNEAVNKVKIIADKNKKIENSEIIDIANNLNKKNNL